MNCNPTLTAEEFKTVHNALCDLDSICRQLEDILKPELYVKLARAGSTIRKGLQGAYAQDNDAFERKNDQYRHWQEHYGLKSIWSIYEVENMTLCHPYKDAEYVVYDQHWGEGGEVVRKIEGRDWNSLYRAADAAIQASGDGHHVFIESFDPIEGKPGHLRLSTGS